MLVKNSGNNLIRQNTIKTSLFSTYNKTANNLRAKTFKIKLNKIKKSKTALIYNDNSNNLNINKKIIPSNKANSTINFISNNNLITNSKKNVSKNCSNCFHKKNKFLQINTDDINKLLILYFFL